MFATRIRQSDYSDTHKVDILHHSCAIYNTSTSQSTHAGQVKVKTWIWGENVSLGLCHQSGVGVMMLNSEEINNLQAVIIYCHIWHSPSSLDLFLNGLAPEGFFHA